MRLSEARREYYRRLAKKKGYLSRAAFKLLQIDSRFRILRKGYSVLDLGCSPGGWSQIASRKVGSQGRVVGVDVEPASYKASNFIFLNADINSPEFEERLSALNLKFDIILSDLSPKLIGIWDADSSRQLLLTSDALSIAEKYLKAGGNAVVKLFQGEMLEETIIELKKRFLQVIVAKPPASRKQASEIYAVCMNFRPEKERLQLPIREHQS
ncbi:MAG: RlmE family RNA methyltransferase [Conexivisphaerales archaeon]